MSRWIDRIRNWSQTQAPSPMSTPPQAPTHPSSLPLGWRLLFRLLLHLSAQLRELCWLQRELYYRLNHEEWPFTEETPAREEQSLSSWLKDEAPDPSSPATADPIHPEAQAPAQAPQSPRKLDARDVIQQTREGSINLGRVQQASSLTSAARAMAHRPLGRR